MKKFICFLALMLMFFVPSAVLLAQSTTPEQENNVIGAVYLTLFSLIAAIPVVTEALKNAFKLDKLTPNWVAQMLSWFVGIGLTLIGWYFGLGFLNVTSIWLALLYGFGASLVANGIADTKIVAVFFALFKK